MNKINEGRWSTSECVTCEWLCVPPRWYGAGFLCGRNLFPQNAPGWHSLDPQHLQDTAGSVCVCVRARLPVKTSGMSARAAALSVLASRVHTADMPSYSNTHAHSHTQKSQWATGRSAYQQFWGYREETKFSILCPQINHLFLLKLASFCSSY